MSKLIQNAVHCISDDVYIRSRNTHDFQTHTNNEGKSYFVDGGLSYCRAGGDLFDPDFEDFCLNDDSPIEEINEKLLWGVLGKDGKYQSKLIKTLDLSHLQNILKTQSCLNPIHEQMVKYWIEKKLNIDISV